MILYKYDLSQGGGVEWDLPERAPGIRRWLGFGHIFEFLAFCAKSFSLQFVLLYVSDDDEGVML